MFVIRTQDDLYLAFFLILLWCCSIIAWVFYAVIVFVHCTRNRFAWALSPPGCARISHDVVRILGRRCMYVADPRRLSVSQRIMTGHAFLDALIALFVGFDVVYVTVYVQLAVTLFRYRGQHFPYSNVSIILTPSQATDVQSMVDVTSISQFSVETAQGMYMLMSLTSEAAALLTLAAWTTRDVDRRLWCINTLGYIAFALVGIFGTALPSVNGYGPRRSYNPFFGWTIDANTSQVFHVIAAVLFLFIPLLYTSWFLYHTPSFRRREAFLATYATLLCLNLAFVGTQIASIYDTGTTLDDVWIVIEMITFGCTFVVYSVFQLWLIYIQQDEGKAITPTPEHPPLLHRHRSSRHH